MKRETFALLAALAFSSCMADRVVAQEVKPAAPAARTNNPVRAVPRDQADLVAQRLDLNSEQKEKIRPILTEQFKKLSELRQTPNLKPEEMRAKRIAIREETNAKLKPILTPEQYERYTKPFGTRTNLVAPPGIGNPVAPAPSAPAK